MMPITSRSFIRFLLFGFILTSVLYALLRFNYIKLPNNVTPFIYNYRQRPECSCLRPELPSLLNQSELQSSLCSQYATHRGPNQRIISISLFGPKENKLFQPNKSISLLNELINDMNKIYSDGFVLRIHHDDTIRTSDVICPIECENPNVDFCNMEAKLFIPPKIWRFIPAGDPLVDISKLNSNFKIESLMFFFPVMSRDLDSALTPRERSAVNAWLDSKKSFHSMRDHPMHAVPMLGGMWGFRPSLNPKMARFIHQKIHDANLVKRYNGTGDQSFLAIEIWGEAKSDALAHDSFLCKINYGHKPSPFPTRRPSANETNCFIGCMRPCCGREKMPFPECPIECRPKDHLEWNYC